MVYLPHEILHAIIGELIATTPGLVHLAPLAAINRNWQTVVEDYIWTQLSIEPQEINTLRSVFRKGSGRRKLLRHLNVAFENYFAVPLAQGQTVKDGESAGERCYGDSEGVIQAREEKSKNSNENVVTTSYEDGRNKNHGCQTHQLKFVAFQHEHERFFLSVKKIWNELASWENDIRIVKITFHMTGHSVYGFLGSEFCNTHAEYFSDGRWLYPENFTALPLLRTIKILRVHGTVNEEMDLWPAIVTCKIASTLPTLETLEVDSQDNEMGWPQMRKYLRAGKFKSPLLEHRVCSLP
jgi:hypothetical protein